MKAVAEFGIASADGDTTAVYFTGSDGLLLQLQDVKYCGGRVTLAMFVPDNITARLDSLSSSNSISGRQS